ncbi:MAG: hypothetical protein E7585_03275 [Ruminococcaceae bacterium]|nr:hypothetical protein [Oscillospiraceae bacterium]
MEQIYTIPVNEAFEKSAADSACGCPMCALYRKLEEDELDLILGASMMEPDVRIKTNKLGFCRTHYDMMFVRKNRLGMALTLESHLHELQEDLHKGLLSMITGRPDQKPTKRIAALENSCYVCGRIDFHFQHMAETVVLLYDTDETFVEKMKKQPYFCLPHYRMLLEKAAVRLPKKKLGDFCALTDRVVKGYLETLTDDVSWFCKKFDYRYDKEPWKNSKDSVERAIKFLRSDLHRNDN